MSIIIVIAIVCLIVISLLQFIMFTGKDMKREKWYTISLSFEVFYSLIIIYCLVMIGFGLIYFLLSFHEEILIDQHVLIDETVLSRLLGSLYFSGVTLLTIGYGDVTPLGIARFIAVIQALVGFILPTAFVLKLVHLNFERKRE